MRERGGGEGEYSNLCIIVPCYNLFFKIVVLFLG